MFATSELRRLVALLSAYCALQAGVLFFVHSRNPSSAMAGDAYDYRDSAVALLHTGTVAVSLQDPRPATLRPPGYPVFIASLYSLFGEHLLPVLLAQIAAALGVFLLTYAAAAALWDAATGLTALAFLALDSNFFLRPQLLNTEILFTLLLVAAVLAGIRLLLAPERPPLRYALALGVCLMLATYVRPISYYLPFAVALGLLIHAAAAGWPRRTAAAVVSLSLLPSLLGIGAWQWRNYRATGSAAYSNIVASDLYLEKGGDIVAWSEGITPQQALQRQKAAIDPTGKTKEELYALYWKAAMKLFRAHPVLLARSLTLSLAKVLLVPGETELLSYLGVPLEKTGCFGDLLRLTPGRYIHKWVLGRPALFAFFLFAALQLYALYAGVLYALARSAFGRGGGRAPGVIHAFVLGVVLYFFLVSTVAHTGPRFRVPFTPLLALYAGFGWRGLFTFIARHRAARAASGAASGRR